MRVPVGRERGETGATPSFQGFVRHVHRWTFPTSGAVPHSLNGGSLPSHLSLQEGSDSRKEHWIVSAVRLFCFLIGMVFQQIPPLLDLFRNYLFLLLVRGCALVHEFGLGGCALVLENYLESHKPVDNSFDGNCLERRRKPQERLSAGQRQGTRCPQLAEAVRRRL